MAHTLDPHDSTCPITDEPCAHRCGDYCDMPAAYPWHAIPDPAQLALPFAQMVGV